MRARRLPDSEVPLPTPLDEFRAALQAEIQVARVNATFSAVPLMNGRRVAQIGRTFQYSFGLENVLNLPPDAPGDLTVQDRPNPISVTIIAIDGLTITLSLPEDIGEFVPSARLKSDLTFLLLRLIERIEALAGCPNPAGMRLLDGSSVAGKPSQLQDLVRSAGRLRDNPEQLKAVASSIGRNTTFIKGPPGTGKTRTIGAIGDELYP